LIFSSGDFLGKWTQRCQRSGRLMFALFVAWYTLCRPHMTLGPTPAVRDALASAAWTMPRLLSESAEAMVA